MKKNPDLAQKYTLSNQRNLASGGGGFGPVGNSRIQLYILRISSSCFL
jgi:hypothetical protein